MKRELWIILFFVFAGAWRVAGQDCTVASKANDILPDRLCAPVSVNWEVSYRGVNDAGTRVQIQYRWDDGSVEVVDAVNTNVALKEWTATRSHTYVSKDDKCNYHPEATLIVNGQLCTSSFQEQIVTVWDTDNKNGGHLNISPWQYPICYGNGANVRFQDVTRFNCVPPQENDNPNTRTRWIQWIYGTANTMTGVPVTINGTPRGYPYYGNVITLNGPVTGSGRFSDVINVANDKFIGQFFQVTLRYWNYCNPYDDPNIPGPPADPVNGDHAPMTRTARIIIVPYPDATIDPIPPQCPDGDTVFMTAADGGGRWSGPGIVDEWGGGFYPPAAGEGDHIITYRVTDGNNCSDEDTVVVSVRPGPDATITPVDPQCNYHTSFNLISAAGSGSWSGTGIIDGVNGSFDPAVADTGMHKVFFMSDPDVNGCRGYDSTEIRVWSPPDAWFLSPDSAWCAGEGNSNTAAIRIEGTLDLDYDLSWTINGTADTLTGIAGDTLYAPLLTGGGMNTYRLQKVWENFPGVSCALEIDDTLNIEIWPKPTMKLDLRTDGVCHPVNAYMDAAYDPDYSYFWDFGDGSTLNSDTSFSFHTYNNISNHDTTYSLFLKVETQFGCVDSLRESLPVYPNPMADFLPAPMVQDFPESTVTLINYSSTGSWMYLWEFGDGRDSTVRDPINHVYDDWGDYDISLKVYSEHCADSISKQIRILPPPPVAAFGPDTSGCGPLMVQFDNVSLYGEHYYWDFDDGTFSYEKNPVHVFMDKKRHRVTLTVTGPTGIGQAWEYVTVHPDPEVAFSIYPQTTTRTDQLFKFINNSLGAISYEWDFGDGATSTDAQPSHVYGQEGNFDITLYAWNEFSCTDTLIKESLIEVIEGEGEMKFPNVFRWNGFGPTGGYWEKGAINNTVFHPHFENVVEYDLTIYSRWGELLYESFELQKGWDGYIGGTKLAPQGVYVYKAWVKYLDGREDVIVGDVTFMH